MWPFFDVGARLPPFQHDWRHFSLLEPGEGRAVAVGASLLRGPVAQVVLQPGPHGADVGRVLKLGVALGIQEHGPVYETVLASLVQSRGPTLPPGLDGLYLVLPAGGQYVLDVVVVDRRHSLLHLEL